MRRIWRACALLTLVVALSQRTFGAQSRPALTDSAKTLDSLAERRKREQVREAEARLHQLLRDAASYRRAGDRRMEGVTLRRAGNVYLDELRRPDSALPLYQRAHEIARAVGNLLDDFSAAYNIKLVQSNGTFEDSALVFWQEALSVARRAGDRLTEGQVLVYISQKHQRSDSVLKYAKQAAEIARELRGRLGDDRAWTFYSVANAYLRLGQLDSAETYYREAIRVARESRDRDAEAASLGDIGNIHAQRGHFDSTFAYYAAALETFRDVGNRVGEASWLNNLGNVHLDLGRLDSSLVYYRRGLAIAKAIDHQPLVLGLTLNIGGVFTYSSRADSAMVYLRRAIALSREADDKRSLSQALARLGEAQRDFGQPDSALANLRAGIALMRDLQMRNEEAGARGVLGSVHAAAGRADSALTAYREGLRVARESESRVVESTLLRELGDLYARGSAQHSLAIAHAYYDSAAAIRAAVSATTGADQNRVSFAETGGDLFEGWTLAWLARSDEVGPMPSALAALAVAERGKAQALLDLLRRGQAGDSLTAGTTASQVVQRAGVDLVQEGRDIAAGVATTGVPVLAYMATKDTLLTWLILPSGEVTMDRQRVARDSVARLVAEIRARLGADEALSRSLRGIDPVERSALPGTRERRGTGTRGRAATDTPEVLGRSATVLVPASLAGRLPPGGELVVVPHGPLGLVPFAALQVTDRSGGATSGEPLGARFAIRYAPSLTTLRVVTQGGDAVGRTERTRGESLTRKALVVGNPAMPRIPAARGGSVRLPALPGAGREGQWVAQALGATLLTGHGATERAVRSRLAAATVVHLATHGFAYSADAKVLDSFVAFASDSAADKAADGLLTVGEVIDDVPRLTAELVVLSACQTGLGNLRQAEGTVGLQRAFLAKGARSVLVSLWSVSDRATELLMRRFYTHWLRDADAPSKAEALRRAQSDVRGTRGFDNPRFWAAFQLVGAQ